MAEGTVAQERSSYYGGHGPALGATCEHSRMVDGRMMLVRYCGYCWAEYLEPKGHKAYFCSKVCRERNAAWLRWIDDSNAVAVRGDVRKPAKAGAALPPGGASLFAAIEAAALPSVLVESAA